MIRTIRFKAGPRGWIVDDNHGIGPYACEWEKKFASKYLHRSVSESLASTFFLKGSKNMFVEWELRSDGFIVAKVYSGNDAKYSGKDAKNV